MFGLLKSPQKKVFEDRKNVSSAHKLDGLGKIKGHAPRSEHVHLHQDIGHIYTQEPSSPGHWSHIYARTIFKPRCCLNFQSMRTQAEPTYIAHSMFGQIKMEILWYIIRHTLISRRRDGKPRMIGGQFVVVHVGVHQLSVSLSKGQNPRTLHK